jgi:hypothetical protein
MAQHQKRCSVPDVGEWNPRDPDADTVRYDLSEWSVDERADATEAFAEAEIAHAWEGHELLVSADDEARADAVLDELEDSFDDDDEGDDDGDGGSGLTEYDLEDLSDEDRARLTEMLDTLDIGYRWEGDVMVVQEAHEDVVESCLRTIDGRDVEIVEED